MSLWLGTGAVASELRVVTYNLHDYPGTTSSLRHPKFRTVLAPLAADVIVGVEVQSAAGLDSFRLRVLEVLEPGQWAAAPFHDGNASDQALFYKPAKAQLAGHWGFYADPATAYNLTTVYRLKLVQASGLELRIYAVHFRAGSGAANVAVRADEAEGVRDSLNAMRPGTHALVAGDFNMYASTEPGFTMLLESQSNNVGRVYDPKHALGTWHDAQLATLHTRSPCKANCPSGFGYPTSGLGERFDLFLPTLNLSDTSGLHVLPETYRAVGNDGQHYQNDLNVPPTIPEGQPYADALVYASDHLPLIVHLQLPPISDLNPPRLWPRLLPPQPNPCGEFADIRFQLEQASHARIDLVDVAGRRVATLATGAFSPGSHLVRWTIARDRSMPPGVYFVRLTTPASPPRSARLVYVR